MNQREHTAIFRACQEHNRLNGIKVFEQGYLGIQAFRDAFGNRRANPMVYVANSDSSLAWASYLNKSNPVETLAAVASQNRFAGVL